MRKDWAEAVDFPIKSTYKISEVLEFAKKIKESDPGNLGDKLIPIAQAPSNAVRLFVGSNSTYYNGFYKDKDGTYKWGATSQETLEGLKMYAEAYQSGLLDPNFTHCNKTMIQDSLTHKALQHVTLVKPQQQLYLEYL